MFKRSRNRFCLTKIVNSPVLILGGGKDLEAAKSIKEKLLENPGGESATDKKTSNETQNNAGSTDVKPDINELNGTLHFLLLSMHF